MTIPNTGTETAPNYVNKNVIFKNCVPFTNCISKINNTQKDYANDIDIVMHMHNLIVIFIQKHQDVYGNTIEMNQLWTIILILMIFLLIMTIDSRANRK